MWLEFLTRFVAIRFGIISRKDGRWYRYHHGSTSLSVENQMVVDGLFDRDLCPPSIVPFDVHSIVSSRRFLDLFGFTKIHLNRDKFQRMPPETRVLIDFANSNIYLPGMDFREYLQDVKGSTVLVIFEPEYDHFFDVDLSNVYGGTLHVMHSDPKEAIVFKLSHF